MDPNRQIKTLKRYDPAAYEIAIHCYWKSQPIIDSHKHRLMWFVQSRAQARVALTIHELLAQLHGTKRSLNKDELKCLHGTSLDDR
jgi:hypothetical protein